jgi:hypothetical protein
MRKIVFYVVLLVAGLILSCQFEFGPQTTDRIDYSNADLSYDRSQFGNAPFPFWFNLKPVEVRALQDIFRAKAGDPDALLALALLASGDVRDSLSFNKYMTRVLRFVAKVGPVIAAERDFRQKGRALFASMRSEFMKSDSGGDLSGYDSCQSRLSILFETGKYNCLSSAVLYIVLARYFDMPVMAVVVPSHVFVQMTAPDGTVIEIETTAKTGFGWVNDEEYYTSRSFVWFSSRGLPQSTYEDYKKRRFAEPYRLVCGGMTGPHTAAAMMKSEDSNRLKEIRGFALDDDPAAQAERFAVYGLEFQHLNKSGDYRTAERMFAKVMPSVAVEQRRFPDNADVGGKAAVLEYNYATVLLMLRNHDEFVAETRAALDELAKSGTTDTSEMCKGLLVNVYNYIRFSMDDMGNFADADSLATDFAPYAKNQEWFLGNLQTMYGTRLRSIWEKKDWPEAVRIIRKQKAIDFKGKNGAMITKNLEAAFVNWSLSFSNDGNWRKAEDVLKECVQDSASTPECGGMLDELQKAHP